LILCDIGNTNTHLLIDGVYTKTPSSEAVDEFGGSKVYYICVNAAMRPIVAARANFIDLAPHIELESSYKGLGVDRACAAMAVEDGVVVDAGSAITIDIMKRGVHQGGYILPGLAAYERAYASISPALALPIDGVSDLSKTPQNTRDAMNCAVMRATLLLIEKAAGGGDVICTGGDGELLARHIKNARYDEKLVFKGMAKIALKLEERC
jgi:type III pantothenate kinase